MRLIDADVLIEQIKNPYTEYPVMIKIRKAIEDMINEAPTVDAEPVRHERWVNTGFMEVKCSECSETFHELESTNYCPNCGAKMEKEK